MTGCRCIGSLNGTARLLKGMDGMDPKMPKTTKHESAFTSSFFLFTSDLNTTCWVSFLLGGHSKQGKAQISFDPCEA